MKLPSEHKELNDNNYLIRGSYISEYNSPVISEAGQRLLMVCEKLDQRCSNIISVDGNNIVNIKVMISDNAKDFSEEKNIGGNSSFTPKGSHGSPVVFTAGSDDVIVLATEGSPGYGGGNANDITKLSVSRSTNQGRTWTKWADIDTNVFEPLTKEGYNRFCTSAGRGLMLRNGTFVCMIDYKKDTDADSKGTAMLYSKDKGNNWALGPKMIYTAGYQFARVMLERKDGSLLIAAMPKIPNNIYDGNGKLYWASAGSLQDNSIKEENVSGLSNSSSGSISMDSIKFAENGMSFNGLVLIHSIPDRKWRNPNGNTVTVKNAMSLSISKDEGRTWSLVTNEFGVPPNKTSFRQSVKILRDGTIAVCTEEGEGPSINPASDSFNIVYRRFGLSYISDDKYIYEGM